MGGIAVRCSKGLGVELQNCIRDLDWEVVDRLPIDPLAIERDNATKKLFAFKRFGRTISCLVVRKIYAARPQPRRELPRKLKQFDI